MTIKQIFDGIKEQNLSVIELSNRLVNAVNEVQNIAKSTQGTINSRNYELLNLNIRINVIKSVLCTEIEAL